jgi:hypothetical protein
MVLATLVGLAVVGIGQHKTPYMKSFEKSSERGWVFVRNDPLRYDPKTVIRYDGKVVGVIESASVSLMVKVKGGAISVVDLGPKSYYDAQAMHIHVHDVVGVKGSKVIQDGKGTVLAAELTHHGSKVAFRSLDGRPLWSSSR